jgi:hypothetical protein
VAGAFCGTSETSMVSPARIVIVVFIPGVCRIPAARDYWTLVLLADRSGPGSIDRLETGKDPPGNI